MKIRTKLQIITIFSLVAALVVSSILFFATQKVDEAIKKSQTADEIIKGLFELNLLANKYLVHRQERAKAQWESKHSSLKKLLKEAELRRPEEMVFLTRIRENHESVKAIFEEMTLGDQGHRNQKESIVRKLAEAQKGSMDAKSSSMVSDAYQLARISNAKLAGVQHGGYLLVFLLFCMMVGATIGVSLLINKNVVKPVKRLHGEIESFGAGNLDHKAGDNAQDEVGQLSKAFDRMTVQLKESFAGLEKEVSERKRAEEALNVLLTRQEALLAAVPDIIMEVDCNKVYTWANRAGIAFFGEDVIGKEAASYFEDGQDTYGVVKPLFGGDENVFYVESWQRRRDGEKRLLAWWCRALKDRDGNVMGALSSARDITGQKQAEEALFDSEQRYRNLVENAPDVIYTLAPNGAITSLNPAFERITGWSRSEWLGKPFTSLLHPDDLFRSLAFFQRVLEGEKPSPFELRIIEKSGGYKVGEFMVTPQILNDSLIGVLGVARNITERKRMEEALQKSEERFRQLYDNAPLGYHEYDSEGRITRVNRTDLEMLGYTAEEMIGQFIWKLNVGEETVRQEVLEKLSGARPPGRALERTYKRKDGTTVPVLIEDRLIWGEKGRIAGIRSTVQDITKRKKVEEGAKQLAEENAIMAEIGRIISSTLDIDQVYEGFSKEVKKIIPFDRIVINLINMEKGTVRNVYISGRAIEDRNLRDAYLLEGSVSAETIRTRSTLLIQTDDFKEYRDRYPMLESTFQAGFRSIMNVPLFSKGKVIGGLLLRSRNPFAYTDKDVKLAERIASQIAGAVANAQLYAERVQAEDQRAALEEQLRQSQKMEAIGRLAGGIAHDFNNLLTVIKGYTQLSLARIDGDKPLEEDIEEIEKAGDRAADLTRQLLAFSRRQIMELRLLDLNSLLKNLDKMLRRVIGEDVELITVMAKDLGRIKADPGQIEQIMMNLAVNARDAMPDGGRLIIETANAELDAAYAHTHVSISPGRYVMISVSDTGIGMTPQVKDRIFEPFFTTKERGKGTGLGLSTVYGIVKQSDGSVWVYSEPGKGTTFKIYLPRVDDSPKELEEKETKKESPRGRETILIVEDEAEVRKLTRLILLRQGYKILEAGSGEEAMKICQEGRGPFHLLLTDVVMPQMNGRQLGEQLGQMQMCRPLKVLYMSGYTDNAIVRHGVLERGMNYIQKPFTVDGLARKVREVLDRG